MENPTLGQTLSCIPVILRTVLRRCLFLSPVAPKQGMKMELIVALIRAFMNLDSPLTKVQRASLRDPGVKNHMWISKVGLPKPVENGFMETFLKAVNHHKSGNETFTIPELLDVEAEWTGYRKAPQESPALPDISEEEKYAKLMESVTEDMTIMYIHGGAYYLMDPCTHRETTTKLAQLTGARCLSIRYRLCPSFPFPAGLLDALVAYLNLLSPPEGSLHAPVPANKIVFAGDSAGGGLSFALLQLLLTLQRIIPSKTIRFHGKDVPIDVPAGVATISPWCDVTRSLPSITANTKYDYIPAPTQIPGTTFTPLPFPADEMWPVSPPRVDFYADANMVTHPMVSPICGPAEIWKGSPPIFMTFGEECLEDEDLYFARRLHSVGGIKVAADRYEGMPHCFAMIDPSDKVSLHCLERWAKFCVDAVHDRVEGVGEAQFINHTATNIEPRKLEDIGSLSDEEVQKIILEGRDWRVEGELELVKNWKAKANL
ncbi:hypothetical protein FQN57_003374 [Myotisia sp. PD_48]|nr:hypothetical protein FQN57_003374 [Myotisia sp. PD_48]